MSIHQLPSEIDVKRASEQSLVLSGIYLLKDLKRLASQLYRDQGEISVWTHFEMNPQKKPYIRGNIKTTLILQCQRCLDAFEYDIIAEFAFGIITVADKFSEAPLSEEVILAEDGLLMLRDVVEDEIILGIPIVPKHNLSQCLIKLPVESENAEQVTKNPFQVLKQLKEHD